MIDDSRDHLSCFRFPPPPPPPLDLMNETGATRRRWNLHSFNLIVFLPCDWRILTVNSLPPLLKEQTMFGELTFLARCSCLMEQLTQTGRSNWICARSSCCWKVATTSSESLAHSSCSWLFLFKIPVLHEESIQLPRPLHFKMHLSVYTKEVEQSILICRLVCSCVQGSSRSIYSILRPGVDRLARACTALLQLCPALPK